MTEEDEIELRAIAAGAVNSLLPQAATQQACRSYAEYKCAPLLKRIAELEAALAKAHQLHFDEIYDNADVLGIDRPVFRPHPLLIKE